MRTRNLVKVGEVALGKRGKIERKGKRKKEKKEVGIIIFFQLVDDLRACLSLGGRVFEWKTGHCSQRLALEAPTRLSAACMGLQKGPKRSPKGAQKGPKRSPKGTQKEPKRSPKWQN